MKKIFVFTISFLLALVIHSQTANDFVPQNDDVFRWGTNPGWGTRWSNFDLADLAAGNPESNVLGAGCNTYRVSLPHSHLEQFGYEISLENYEYYNSIGLKNFTAFIGGVFEEQRSSEIFCDERSKMWENMYEPIWDNGENGTPVNDNNYFALYVYKTVSIYGDYIKFWEIINEPDFTYSSYGWEPIQNPNSWLNVNPNPCDLHNMLAPIQQYVRVLRIAYEVIKYLNPQSYVAVGGIGYDSFLDIILRTTDNPVDGTITSEYPLYGGAYFDCLSFHKYPMYGLRKWSNETMDWEFNRNSDAALENFVEAIDTYQSTLNKHGYDGQTFPKKVIICTETNIPREQYAEYIGSDQAQYNYLSKLYVKAQAKELAQVHTYMLWDNPNDFENYSSMGYYQYLRDVPYGSQVENSAAIATRTSSILFKGFEFSKDYTEALNLPENIDGAVFKKDDSLRVALWAKTMYDRSEWATATYTIPSFTGESTSMKKYLWNFGANGIVQELPLAELTLNSNVTVFEFPYSDSTISIQLENSCFYDGNIESNIEGYSGSGYINLNSNVGSYISLFINAKNTSSETISIRYMNNQQNTFYCAVNINGTVVAQELAFPPTSNQWSEVSVDMNFVQGKNGLLIRLLSEDTNVLFDEIHTSFNLFSADCNIVIDNSLNANNYVPVYDGNLAYGANAVNIDTDYENLSLQLITDGIGIEANAVRLELSHNQLETEGFDMKKELLNSYNSKGVDNVTVNLNDVFSEFMLDQSFCANSPKLWKNMYSPIWDNGENGTPINDTNYFAVFIYKSMINYSENVKVWEIIAEPDKTSVFYEFKEEWFETDPNPCDLVNIYAPVEYYIRALRIAYEIIKNNDSNNLVSVGGLSKPSFLDVLLRKTDNPENGTIANGYNNYGGAYFDCIGINVYPTYDNVTSSDNAINYTKNKIAQFYSVLNNYGYNSTVYPSKHIYISNTNVPYSEIGNNFGTYEYQKNFISKLYAKASSMKLKQVYCHSIIDVNNSIESESALDYMGLNIETPTGVESVISADAIKTLNILLQGYSYSSLRTSLLNLPNNVDGAVYEKNDSVKVLLWAKNSLDRIEQAEATYSFASILDDNTRLKRYELNYSQTQEFIYVDSEVNLSTDISIFEVDGDFEAVISIVQFEDAYMHNGQIDAFHFGYNGVGYLKLPIFNTAYTTMEVYSEIAGVKTVFIRYANDTDNAKPTEIIVNGNVSIPLITFPSMPSITDWVEVQVEIELVQGYNSITFQALSNNGLPLLDQLSFSGMVHAIVTETQEIHLEPGWNFVSLYLQPNDTNVLSVFPNAEVVKDMTHYYDINSIYDFLNRLNSISQNKAYHVYNSVRENISVVGRNTDWNYSDLNNGWNLFGLPINNSVYVGDLPFEFNTIKSYDSFYSTDDFLGTLRFLEPGEGYFIFK